MIAIIPARGGSKSIPKKNIADLNGFPMLAYTIAVAHLSKSIDRIIVSTDDEEIAEVAKRYGAGVPFLRPAEFSTDKAGDKEVLLHAVNWLKQYEKIEPAFLMYLRPTTPLRDPQLIDLASERIQKSSLATSLRSAHETAESAYKYFKVEDEFFSGLFPDYPIPNYFDLPRQLLPLTYHPNGYVDIVLIKTLLNSGGAFGDHIFAFVTPPVIEIDRIEELQMLRYHIERNSNPLYEYLLKHYS